MDGQFTYDGGANKCNMFVYDMLQSSGMPAPTYTYDRRGPSWLTGTATVPSLAGHWADFDNSPTDITTGWGNINFQNEQFSVIPGSILAIGANYSNATGHVGIISYPLDGQGNEKVQVGLTKEVYIIMQGQTISAGGTSVVENDWGFRTSSHPEKNSLNSPSAGIEIEPIKTLIRAVKKIRPRIKK